MAVHRDIHLLVVTVLHYFLVYLMYSSGSMSSTTAAATPLQPSCPALWVFGDSLVDSGNNNYLLLALAKANLPPNGIDFPSHLPTGRFCNGKHSIDILCDYMGLPYPPPAKAPSSRGIAILKGLNYASGAGGILDATGANFIDRISFNGQIKLFQQTILELKAILGESAATELLRTSLYATAFGGNDYINNYLLESNNATRIQYTPSQFVDLLISTLESQLTTLYSLGARKVAVFAVGPLGCIPSRLAIASADGSCVASDNELVLGFNQALKSLLLKLTQTLPGSMFLYGNAYDPVYDLIRMPSPSPSGFNVVNRGCCGGGKYNGAMPCLPVVDTVCANRNEYLFWDAYHPTQAFNEILGRRMFLGPPSDISPMNIQQLFMLHRR